MVLKNTFRIDILLFSWDYYRRFLARNESTFEAGRGFAVFYYSMLLIPCCFIILLFFKNWISQVIVIALVYSPYLGSTSKTAIHKIAFT